MCLRSRGWDIHTDTTTERARIGLCNRKGCQSLNVLVILLEPILSYFMPTRDSPVALMARLLLYNESTNVLYLPEDFCSNTISAK